MGGWGGGGAVSATFKVFVSEESVARQSVCLSLFATACLLLLLFRGPSPPSVGSLAPRLSASFHEGLGAEPAC